LNFLHFSQKKKRKKVAMLQAQMKVPIGSLAGTIEKTGGQSAGKTRTFVREPSETIRLAILQFDENKNSFF
jgi:hypothetical protein